MNIIEWFNNRFIPKYKPNKKEELVLSILKNLLEQDDTDIKMAPITARYYLVNKRLEYWVKVSEDGISITNHKFTYSSSSPMQFQDMVISIIKEAIEESRTKFESTVFQNEIELLESIIKNIKEKQ
jgi:hypothetical protein